MTGEQFKFDRYAVKIFGKWCFFSRGQYWTADLSTADFFQFSEDAEKAARDAGFLPDEIEVYRIELAAAVGDAVLIK